MDSFAKHLEMSLDNIPASLLNASNKNKFLKMAVHLPCIFAHSLFGYEKALTDESGMMDLSISAVNNNEKYSFSGVFDYPDIADYSSRNIHWKRLKEFSRQWSNNKSSLYKNLEMIALEFDLSSLKESTPVPSVFFGIETLRNTGFNHELRLNVFIEAVETVTGKTIGTELKQLLIDVTSKAENFHLFQVGLMLSRTDSPLKICLKRFNAKQLLDFLPKVIQDEKLIDEINCINQKYLAYFDHFVLVFDISGSEINRTGIECYFRGKKQPLKENRWEEVILQLTRDGLCTKQNAESIINFPGKYLINNTSPGYPEYYAQGLHHIKFSVKEAQSASAKIYFWSGFHWE